MQTWKPVSGVAEKHSNTTNFITTLHQCSRKQNVAILTFFQPGQAQGPSLEKNNGPWRQFCYFG